MCEKFPLLKRGSAEVLTSNLCDDVYKLWWRDVKSSRPMSYFSQTRHSLHILYVTPHNQPLQKTHSKNYKHFLPCWQQQLTWGQKFALFWWCLYQIGLARKGCKNNPLLKLDCVYYLLFDVMCCAWCYMCLLNFVEGCSFNIDFLPFYTTGILDINLKTWTSRNTSTTKRRGISRKPRFITSYRRISSCLETR